MIDEFAQHVLACAGVVHQTHQSGPQLTVGDILSHIPANAAMDLLHRACVSAGGDECGLRIPLDVYKYCADNKVFICLITV